MPSGVLDATVVIGLAKGDVFHRLAAVYAPLYVPAGIRREVVQQGQGRAGVAELTQALGGWLTEIAANPATAQQFAAVRSAVDREVLAVAKDQQVDQVLSDDKIVRREAQALGLITVSTPEIVVLFKQQGLISAVKPVLQLMRQRGFGISTADYAHAVHAAGEPP